ncbi:MAG: transposase [Phycisphaeraceae bacterium]|nr:transposase [Phycisphaeraceae bacterium]
MAIAFLITFRTYGTWLPGKGEGTVDRRRNARGTPTEPVSTALRAHAQANLSQQSVRLAARERAHVVAAIHTVCEFRRWKLHALSVRSNHVHVVVTADASPERAMTDFKSYATRALRLAKLNGPDQKVWARHGSTRHLHDETSLLRAIAYVLDEQGIDLKEWDVRRDNPQDFV